MQHVTGVLKPGVQPYGGDRFARYSLLIIVLVATVVFFNMIKAFLVPVILAAVIAGLFFPFYAWLLKRTRGRQVSKLVCVLRTALIGTLASGFRCREPGRARGGSPVSERRTTGPGVFRREP